MENFSREVIFLPGSQQAKRLGNEELIDGATHGLEQKWRIIPVSGNLWNPLEVRLTVPPERTHGTGENPLHVDYISHPYLPRYIAFLCLRSDPNGGGATYLSSFAAGISKCSAETVKALRSPLYSYWADPTGEPFGAPLDCFSILPPELGEQPVRFSAKMLDSHLQAKQEVILRAGERGKEASVELARFAKAMAAVKRSVRLQRADMLIFDQFHFAHGRGALVGDQGGVPIWRRRLLMQAYLTEKRPQPHAYSSNEK